jgi:hypothetical protein
MPLFLDELEEYTHYHVHSWALMGFRFVICHNQGDYSIITPCLFNIPNELLSRYANQYLIPIADEQCFEMADGVDEIHFYTHPLEKLLACVLIQNN